MSADSSSKTYPVQALFGWEKNPRVIDGEEKARLKNQLRKLGQYKPLIVTLEGDKPVVLGGNMRLTVMRELADEGDKRFIDVWVSIVDAPDEKTRLEYALSDNDRAGRYDEKALAEMIQGMDAGSLQDYRLDVGFTTSLEAIGKRYDITTETEAAGRKSGEKDVALQNMKHKCPNCEYEFDD